MLILLNKPFNVLCQFTGESGQRTLAECLPVPGVYAAGRLDADSEGLLVLTDDGMLQKRIADPRHKLPKTYLAQVEGVPDEAALARLRAGVDLGEVGLGQLVLRIGDALLEQAVVGEDEQALAVGIEPAGGIHAGHRQALGQGALAGLAGELAEHVEGLVEEDQHGERGEWEMESGEWGRGLKG